jgi:hypothetical protein
MCLSSTVEAQCLRAHSAVDSLSLESDDLLGISRPVQSVLECGQLHIRSFNIGVLNSRSFVSESRKRQSCPCITL